MVLMNAGKKARNAASLSNKTTTYGAMAGLAPRIGAGTGNNGIYRHIQRKGVKSIPALNGLTPVQQKIYLVNNKLVSVNPLSSGGVGKKTLMFR